MDWRNRKYYLVVLATPYREDKIKKLKEEIFSFKMHPPYRHHKNAAKLHGSIPHDAGFFGDEYDSLFFGGLYWEAMVGCDAKDASLLEDMLRESYCKYKEITKEMCGQ